MVSLIIPHADYGDDLLLLGNTPAEAESLLHSMEQSSSGIGLCVNSDKTGLLF